MTRNRWRLRIAALTSLLALALVAGMSAAAAAPADSDTNGHNCRPTTWIHGLVENRTDRRIVLGQDGLAPTTRWCQEPSDDVRAHQSDSWRAGSTTGTTDLFLVYLLDNGDLVQFQARVVQGGAVDVRCSYALVVQEPRTYRCLAEDVMSADHFAFVRFSLVPRGR